MTFDMNDAGPQKTGELIPDGTFAKLTMLIHPGGVDGDEEVDRGLLKRSATPGSDVLMLDCEFTVAGGPHVRRKFWQTMTVKGGKVDENGASIGANITKSTLRAMIESALGLDPEDVSEDARAKRVVRGFADFSGFTFVGKIAVETQSNPAYPERNRLDRVVLPNEPEWRKVMDGEPVPPRPTRRKAANAPAAPAWGGSKTPPARSAPAWTQDAPQQQPSEPDQPAAPSRSGPAWLNS